MLYFFFSFFNCNNNWSNYCTIVAHTLVWGWMNTPFFVCSHELKKQKQKTKPTHAINVNISTSVTVEMILKHHSFH